VREVAIDFAHPPKEETLRNVLAEPMPILSWHLGVNEDEQMEELPPEFAPFAQAILEDERHRHLLLLSLDNTIHCSEKMIAAFQAYRETFSPLSMLLETGHPSWKSRSTQARMKREKIEHVLIDAPPLFGIVKDVGYTMPRRSYLRILGRNPRTWFDPPPEKYVYNYSMHELQEIATRITKLREESEEVFVIFVNHPLETAERNVSALGASLVSQLQKEQEREMGA